MKFRGTLITLVVAAALAGYLFYSEWQKEQRATRRDSLDRVVRIDDFESLRFSFSRKQIALQKKNDTWIVNHPVSAPCDPQRVQAFLDTLRAARIEERVGSGNLSRYGLDHPAVELNIQAADGTTTRLRLGRINPLQTLVYALVGESDEVILTTSSLLTYSLTSDFGWRDKRMISVAADDVVRMRFRAANAGSLRVRRDAQRGWVVENRNPWRVDPLGAENVVRVLSQLSAIGVAAENKEDVHKFGLDSRKLSAILEAENGRVVGDVVFGFAQAEGTYYAMVPDKPEIFEAENAVVTAFVDFARDYRDRKAFAAFNPADVQRIEVGAPTDSFTLERRGLNRWVVTQSTKHDTTFVLDPGRMVGMLEDLMTMPVAEFPKAQPATSVVDPPEWRIDIHGSHGWLSGLEVGRRDPNGLHTFVRGTRDEWWVLLSVSTLLGLPFDLERLGTEEVDVGDDRNRG